jgi:hypothetical protein
MSLKIAVCLCGQPRQFRKAHELSYDAVYRDRDCDFFLHAWHNPEQEGQHYVASSGHGGGLIETETPRKLLEHFQPKKWMILPQMHFDTEGYHVDGTVTPHLFGNYSWTYSISLVGKVLGDYEARKGFRYDRVLLMRYDLHIRERLPIEDIDPTHMHTLDTGLGLTYALTDQLFLSGRDAMEHLFGLYRYMHEKFRRQGQFNSERNSHDLMVERGIPMKLLHGNYSIIRG